MILRAAAVRALLGAGLALALASLALVLASPALAAHAGAPASPSALRVVSSTTSSITLGWGDRAHDERRYEVGYRRSATRRFTTRRLRRGSRRFVHRRLRRGTAYTYRVRACNRRGCSRFAGPLRARTRRGRTRPGGSPELGGCPVLPRDNPLNADVSSLPVHPRSDRYIASIGSRRFLHADFGTDFGIPFVVVPEGQRRVPVTFTAFGDESDPGPYPMPLDAPVEEGGDRHAIALEQGDCKLYELYRAQRAGEGWEAESGAVFDLRSNRLRPLGFTSADAAGLPILPGLARYDEVASGRVEHALRFTVSRTQRGYILPATHFASSSEDPDLPPMGLRLRLRRSYDISRFRGQARVILEGLRRHGMIVADNGSDWFISGAPDPRWDNEDLDQLKAVPGSAFEAVETGRIRR